MHILIALVVLSNANQLAKEAEFILPKPASSDAI